MKLLLGSLLLAGACWLGDATDIPSMPNFKVRRIAKTWYPLAVIPSGPVSRVDFPPLRFLVLPNGNLKYRIKVCKNGRCTNDDTEMIKEGQPGNYVTTEPPNSIRFVDTDYNTYLIVYITLGSDTFLALAGGQPIYTPAMKQKFKSVVTSLGIIPEIILGSVQETF